MKGLVILELGKKFFAKRRVEPQKNEVKREVVPPVELPSRRPSSVFVMKTGEGFINEIIL